MLNDESHCVRWSRYKDKDGEKKYTLWHFTHDSKITLCKRFIPLCIENGSFLPDIDSNPQKIECKHCREIFIKENKECL